MSLLFCLGGRGTVITISLTLKFISLKIVSGITINESYFLFDFTNKYKTAIIIITIIIKNIIPTGVIKYTISNTFSPIFRYTLFGVI